MYRLSFFIKIHFKNTSLGALVVVQRMHDMVVELALAGAHVHELRDGPVPRDVAGVNAGAAGAHVGELCVGVGARGLGEADGCGAEQAAGACSAW